jgi:hypothetical protein
MDETLLETEQEPLLEINQKKPKGTKKIYIFVICHVLIKMVALAVVQQYLITWLCSRFYDINGHLNDTVVKEYLPGIINKPLVDNNPNWETCRAQSELQV